MTEPRDVPDDRLILDGLSKSLSAEEFDRLDGIEAELRRRAAPPSRFDGETSTLTLSDGQELIPVWEIERDVLQLMSQDRFLEFGGEHPDWLSYRDANGHVRWKPVASDPLPAA